MNRLYLIIPVILLLLSGGIYFQHAQNASAQAAFAATSAATARQNEAAAQHALELTAKADAEQRLATLRAEEKKQADDKRAKWDADTARLLADTTAAAFKAATLATEAAQLETQLAVIRATKDRLGRELFDLEKSNELARLAKRTTELETQLEIQRLTAMLARTATAPPATP